jgi:hypothetical protein
VLAGKSRADLTGEHLRISASGSLPLFVVELPSFLGRASDPEDPLIQPQWHSWFQQAQAWFAAETPAAFLAKVTDLGEPHEIHPRDKKSVAGCLTNAVAQAEKQTARGHLGPQRFGYYAHLHNRKIRELLLQRGVDLRRQAVASLLTCPASSWGRGERAAAGAASRKRVRAAGGR